MTQQRMQQLAGIELNEGLVDNIKDFFRYNKKHNKDLEVWRFFKTLLGDRNATSEKVGSPLARYEVDFGVRIKKSANIDGNYVAIIDGEAGEDKNSLGMSTIFMAANVTYNLQSKTFSIDVHDLDKTYLKKDNISKSQVLDIIDKYLMSAPL